MKISGLQKLTLADYPGKLACTVFLAGCNYECPWCYNPEFVWPRDIEKSPPLSERKLFQFLKEKKGRLEAVCLGGGEPTINSDLPLLCWRIKKLGYVLKISTNGSNPTMLQYLIDRKLVDYVAMDVKAPKEKYTQVIGLEDCTPNYLLEKLETSIKLLKEGKVDYEFCTTVNPFLWKEDILAIAGWIKPAKRYFLQTFDNQRTLDPYFQTLRAHSKEELGKIIQALTPFFETCTVR